MEKHDLEDMRLKPPQTTAPLGGVYANLSIRHFDDGSKPLVKATLTQQT